MRILYTGLELPKDWIVEEEVVHASLIEVTARPRSDSEIAAMISQCTSATHLIFTSKIAVRIFFEHYSPSDITNQTIISVGKGTSNLLKQIGLPVSATADDERAEGVITLLEQVDLSDAFVLWPHSSRARPLISDWLKIHGINHLETPLYDTTTVSTAPDVELSSIDTIYFTSPSTVDAFWELFGPPSQGTELQCIGSVTSKHLEMRLAT